MCFWFDAWCCFGAMPRHDDYPPPPPRHQPPAERNNNGHYHYGRHANGLGHNRAPHHQHQQLPIASDEEDRKASNDARRGHNTPAGAAGAGAQEKAYYVYSGADGTLGKQQHPATKASIVDGARLPPLRTT